MALEDIGQGILKGQGNERPGEDRIFVPFPEGTTHEEAYIASCIAAGTKAEGAENNDARAAIATLFDTPGDKVEELGGKPYKRFTTALGLPDALVYMKKLAAAVRVTKEQGITRDLVHEMMATSKPFPHLDE